MPLRIFLFLFGFGITVISCSYIIFYLNLLSIGYNFFEYVKFISSRVECLIIFVGIILMIITIFNIGGNNELYL